MAGEKQIENVNEGEEKLIEINGIKAPMLKHIKQAQLDSDNDKPNPFLNTDVVTYEESNGFTIKILMTTVLKKEQLEKIFNGNYVYVPYYTTRR